MNIILTSGKVHSAVVLDDKGKVVETPAELASCRVGEPIIAQIPAIQDCVHDREARGGAFLHGDGHRPVQLDHRRRLQAQQRVVEADNFRPVGCRRRRRLAVDGRNGGLDRRVGSPADERGRAPVGNERASPAAAPPRKDGPGARAC